MSKKSEARLQVTFYLTADDIRECIESRFDRMVSETEIEEFIEKHEANMNDYLAEQAWEEVVYILEHKYDDEPQHSDPRDASSGGELIAEHTGLRRCNAASRLQALLH